MARTSDYESTRLPGVVSMTKIKNAIKRTQPHLVAHLSNIRINRCLQGCSGFIEDPTSGRVVYLSTDLNHGTTTYALYRNADHLTDYRGKRNRRCAMDADVIVEEVADLLHSRDYS